MMPEAMLQAANHREATYEGGYHLRTATGHLAGCARCAHGTRDKEMRDLWVCGNANAVRQDVPLPEVPLFTYRHTCDHWQERLEA